MIVLLFDIDGTLIKTGGAGGQALMEAFTESFGISDPHEVPFSGRTDRGIAENLFHLHGVEDSPAHWQLLRDEYLVRLQQYLPLRAGEVLPGVAECLAQLAETPQVATGLLTGNLQQGARLKLEHFGLHHYFRFGGFGDRHVDRDDVAREALAAATAFTGGTLVPEQTWVIGDTPLDIRCARAIGVKVVAVATGWHSTELLRAAQPDLLLDDLSQFDSLLLQLQ